MVPIKKFREAVFYILFAMDGSSSSFEDEGFFMRQLAMTRKNIKMAFSRAQTIYEKLNEIDEVIQKHSIEYEMGRISKVEKTVLRLALFEIFFDDEIPLPVAISEAVRISKKFGSVEGSQFVNGILDAAASSQAGCNV